MGIRGIVPRWGNRLAGAVAEVNARHPWSHNDHFHPWIVSRLPARRERALDIGCGRGELLGVLADHVRHVVGIDTDQAMCEAAMRRSAGLANIRVENATPAEVSGTFDVVTMVAVLHHLDLESALTDVRRLLAPGGRFLCVGLARPASVTDHVWDAASMVTNPVIGYVKHPWVATTGPQPDPFPVLEPRYTCAEIAAAAERVMPGIALRRHLGFRHTLEWTNAGRCHTFGPSAL